MLDGLRKSKFYSKCKSDIKSTRSRIEMIKKKRNATQRYLRNDVAQLLSKGLDINAYGRAEVLLKELNGTICLDMMEQYCEQIADNLGTMDKQMECPEQCREAVSSLMFAAARCAELPELRELRSIFYKRYSNTLDFYVNKQFMEKLKSECPSKEMKIQLLQDVAEESGLEWNSGALEDNLIHESASKMEKVSSSVDVNGLVVKNEFKGGTKFPDYRERNTTEDRLSWKTENGGSKENVLKHNKQESNDPNERRFLKYRSIPPPYVKSDVNTTNNSLLKDSIGNGKVKLMEADVCGGREKNQIQEDDSISKAKPAPKSVRSRHGNPGSLHSGSENDESIKEAVKQGQRVLKFLDNDGPDELDKEEKMMDKLLLHYSMKKSVQGTIKPNSDIKSPPDHHRGVSAKHRSRDGPNRQTSLPGELTNPTEDTPTRHARASSFQPEMLYPNRHVHPNLPDYDDFVARLAALRGK